MVNTNENERHKKTHKMEKDKERKKSIEHRDIAENRRGSRTNNPNEKIERY